jgi:hypothetical protein
MTEFTPNRESQEPTQATNGLSSEDCNGLALAGLEFAVSNLSSRRVDPNQVPEVREFYTQQLENLGGDPTQASRLFR